MSQDIGTTSKCTIKQFSAVASRVTLALPDAMKLSGLDIKTILRHTCEGERLSLAIAAALKMLYDRDVATIPKWYSFSVWKTIRLGTCIKAADAFRTAIKATGMFISAMGDDILSKPAFSASSEEMEIDLVVVSNHELGFTEGAKLEDTYARAVELGLRLCPNEVGPQLRLQYEDQPNGEWLLIAMEPIADSDGDQLLFDVMRNDDGGQYLHGFYGEPGAIWSEDIRFVFSKRK